MSWFEFFQGNPTVTIIFVLFVVLGAFSIIKKRKPQISGGFKPISYLNTKAEQNFFVQLLRKIPSELHVVAKVRLADLCKPDNPQNIVAFNKIARKHVDFVVLERSTSKVLFCIELDDKSHQKRGSIKRDNEKSYALAKAGIVLHRIKASKNYTADINRVLNEYDKPTAKAAPSNEECPRCDSSGLKRIDLGWPNKGKHYFKCDNCTYKSQVSA
jgi:hypothetical protein